MDCDESVEKDAQTPRYKDTELLRRLYLDERLSTNTIAERLDCAPNTVRKYLKEDGVELRSISDANQIKHGTDDRVPLRTRADGYVRWAHKNDDGNPQHIYVHRLLAVAEFGFDAVADSDVHHKNDIKWDNRPDNLEPMTHGEHSTVTHTKLTWLEQLRAAEMYRSGESSYQLGERFDVASGTIIRYLREMDCVEVRDHKEAAQHAQ